MNTLLYEAYFEGYVWARRPLLSVSTHCLKRVFPLLSSILILFWEPGWCRWALTLHCQHPKVKRLPRECLQRLKIPSVGKIPASVRPNLEIKCHTRNEIIHATSVLLRCHKLCSTWILSGANSRYFDPIRLRDIILFTLYILEENGSAAGRSEHVLVAGIPPYMLATHFELKMWLDTGSSHSSTGYTRF